MDAFVAQEPGGPNQRLQALLHADVAAVDGEEIAGGEAMAGAERPAWWRRFEADAVGEVEVLFRGHALGGKAPQASRR